MGWGTSKIIGVETPHVPHASGRYYQNPLSVVSLTTLTLAVNTLYGIPFYVPEGKVYGTINIEVTTLQAAKSIRLGIYADSSGAPGALLTDAGTVTAASTGAKAITITYTLAAGWYWLACVTDGTTAAVRATSQATAMPWLGFTSGTDTTLHAGWSVAFTYAALPNPFTGGGALMTGNVPRVMLGV